MSSTRRTFMIASSIVGGLGGLLVNASTAAANASRFSVLLVDLTARGKRHDPAALPSGDKSLAPTVTLTMQEPTVARGRDLPTRVDLHVGGGPDGEHPFLVWAWRVRNPSPSSLPLSFAAPVYDDGLRLSFTIDGAREDITLHVGRTEGAPKLHRGRYRFEVADPRKQPSIRLEFDVD